MAAARALTNLAALVLLLLLVVDTREQDSSQSLKPQQHSIFESGKRPESLSVTIGNQSDEQAYIKIVRPPEFIHQHSQIFVDYKCRDKQHHIGVQIRASLDARTEKSVFTYVWQCQISIENEQESKKIILRLPRKLAYRPSHQNPHSLTVKYAVVQAWVLDSGAYREIRNKTKDYYANSEVKVLYYARMWQPYMRYEAPFTKSYSWWKQLEFCRPFRPQCKIEPEVIRLITYPVGLSGTYHGVHRLFANYTSRDLKYQHTMKLPNPGFTMVIWVYIVEYCPSGTPLCSIIQRLTWNDMYMTPLIYVNRQGQLHLQIVTEVGEAIAHLTSFKMPREQWLRIVCSFSNSSWEVHIHHGKEWKEHYHTVIKVESEWPVWYDDLSGLHVIGGSELNPGIKGYVGEAVVYRQRVQPLHRIPFPASNHSMFRLAIGEKAKLCGKYLSWIRDQISFYKLKLDKVTVTRTCRGSPLLRILHYEHKPAEPQCHVDGGPRSKNYRFVKKWVREQIMKGHNFDLHDVGTAIFVHASEILELDGFVKMTEIIQLLKQSSCYGNHDASYMLSIILSHGVGVRVDEITAHSYLMYGALENHRMSLLALGNKHVYGLDGIPQDLDQAYLYYKCMADKTRKDRETHAEEDVHTEAVRLTDEDSLEEQTDEEGDLFLWFKHQASQGVVHAQRNMARLLFWGSQGVKRNLEAAAEFYRISAEGGEPSALFDYGIVLLKGQGTPQNYTGALHYLGRAAEQGHAGAINALGWYALEIKDNRTHARDLFMKGRKLGNADAIHNIGHMYIGARYPGTPYVDRINAFKYFSEAALKGQLDSSNMVALFNIRGHPNVTRNSDVAVAWARYVAETSPALGRILAKGLKAFRHHNWPAALFYYLQAADGGIEVGNFNLALLCEENKEGVTSYIEKECVWRYYNLSTRREPKMVDPYAWIKMGDYYWYGCQGNRNTAQAAVMYANGALKGDPHAMFNLAFLVEEGVHIPTYILNSLAIPKEAQVSNVTILIDMYSKCRESYKTEAYMACSLALLRIELIDIWERYHVLVKMSSLLGTLAASVVTISSIYTYLRGHRFAVATV